MIRISAVTDCQPIRREHTAARSECCTRVCHLEGNVCPYVDAIFRPEPPQYEATTGVRFWLSALWDFLSQRTPWSEQDVDD